MLAVTEEDLVACRIRERLYDLVPVTVRSYANGECVTSIAFAWIANGEFRSTSPDLLPLKQYYSIVWEAVIADDIRNAFGENFARDFLCTTFLVNGQSINQVHDTLYPCL